MPVSIHEIELSSGSKLRVHVDPPGCDHLDQIHEVTPSSAGCEECLQVGDEWVHLRLCLTCGRVRCCDDSKNRHSRKHHEASGHAVVRSFEPGEDWMYCFADDAFIEPVTDQ